MHYSGLFEVAPVNRLVLEEALTDDFTDFEDAVIYESARHIGADCIVTRNPKHLNPNNALERTPPPDSSDILKLCQRPDKFPTKSPVISPQNQRPIAG